MTRPGESPLPSTAPSSTPGLKNGSSFVCIASLTRRSTTTATASSSGGSTPNGKRRQHRFFLGINRVMKTAKIFTTMNILTKAKHLIEKGGFVQGLRSKWNESSGTFKYCPLGAMIHACASDAGDRRPPRRTHPAQVSCGGTDKVIKGPPTGSLEVFRSAAHCDSISTWSDKRGRTKEEVIEVFDKAIKIARRSQRKGNYIR